MAVRINDEDETVKVRMCRFGYCACVIGFDCVMLCLCDECVSDVCVMCG